MFPRKALALTLDALKQSTVPLVLTVLGDGIPQEELVKMIRDRGLEGKVDWRGRVPWSEVRKAYKEHDGFLFTSLRDSCAAQLLEAMALGLPIITLDLHGGGSLVPDDAGFKVAVTDPESTALAIAKAIDHFATLTTAERNMLSQAGWERAQTLSWPTRAERAHYLYESILQDKSISRRSFHPEPV
jgi:glycosyltransferase involved in cell wall biosynthesis